MPFISRYKLSNSTPFGFGSAEFTGTHVPSIFVGYKISKRQLYKLNIINDFTESYMHYGNEPL